MWVIDNPWPPFFILLAVAVVLVWRWSRTQQPKLLIGAGCLLLAAGGVHVIDALVVTEAEVVEGNIHEMVAAFQARDLAKTKSFLAPNITPAQVPSMIASAMDFVRVEGDIDVKDLSVTMHRGNTAAISRFRANATVSYANYPKEHQPSRWELGWEKIGGQWKVVRVTRLDWLNDREVSLFHPLSGERQPATPAPQNHAQ